MIHRGSTNGRKDCSTLVRWFGGTGAQQKATVKRGSGRLTFFFFFRIIQYNIDDHTRTYTYPYEHGRQSKGFVLGYGYQHVEWKPAVHVPKL
jgi:hypothetical protein